MEALVGSISLNLHHNFPPSYETPNQIDLSKKELSDPLITKLCDSLKENTAFTGSLILSSTKITDQVRFSTVCSCYFRYASKT